MSDWSNIHQAIGNLGQTKRGMTTPLIDAYRDRGRMWKEGLGRIGDTIGGIADKKFTAGENQKGREHAITMQDDQQTHDAIQKRLDREVQYTQILTNKDIAEMDDATLQTQARLRREADKELAEMRESATNERQVKEIEFRQGQLDQDWTMFEDEMKQRGIEWDDKMDLEGDRLDETIRHNKATEGLSQRDIDLRTNIYAEQAKTLNEPTLGSAWTAIKTQVVADFATLFEGVDPEGYAFNSTIYDLARSNPDVLEDIKNQFMLLASADPYGNLTLDLMELFGGAIGTLPESDTPTVPGADRDALTQPAGEDEERREAVAILGDWLSQPAFGGDIGTWLKGPAFGGDIGNWLKEPVLGYRDQDVGKMLYELADAIPDLIGGNGRGAERRNPDQTTVDDYILELTSGNTDTRRLQEIAESLKSLKDKYNN